MKLIADYHTHTVHSHGTGSVDDNVAAALERGLQTVGITDHSVAHFTYGVKKQKVGDYLSCIEIAKREYAGRIDIKTGIELNLIGIDGSVDMPKGRYDVRILGYHKAAVCRNLKTAWTFMTGKLFHHAEAITEAYMRAIQHHHITIVAHPGYGVPVDYQRLAQACADYGTLFEINNKHGDLKIEDLQQAALTDVKFVISSDAHSPENVGLAPNAIKLALKAGIDPGRIVNITED
jgi:putative hydrolase